MKYFRVVFIEKDGTKVKGEWLDTKDFTKAKLDADMKRWEEQGFKVTLEYSDVITYENNGKVYKVESVTYNGQCINVNGTTITDMGNGQYTVFVESDEIGFDNFEDAYEFAMTKQKDTMWVQ